MCTDSALNACRSSDFGAASITSRPDPSPQLDRDHQNLRGQLERGLSDYARRVLQSVGQLSFQAPPRSNPNSNCPTLCNALRDGKAHNGKGYKVVCVERESVANPDCLVIADEVPLWWTASQAAAPGHIKILATIPQNSLLFRRKNACAGGAQLVSEYLTKLIAFSSRQVSIQAVANAGECWAIDVRMDALPVVVEKLHMPIKIGSRESLDCAFHLVECSCPKVVVRWRRFACGRIFGFQIAR